MKKNRVYIVVLALCTMFLIGCSDMLNKKFGFLTEEISNYSVKMVSPTCTMLSWDAIDNVDGYKIYWRHNSTKREGSLPLYKGTSYCIPNYGNAYSFAVAVIKGEKELKTDFIPCNSDSKLSCKTTLVNGNPGVIIPVADNVVSVTVVSTCNSNRTEHFFDTNQEIKFQLGEPSFQAQNSFSIKYHLNDNSTEESHVFYYSRTQYFQIQGNTLTSLTYR